MIVRSNFRLLLLLMYFAVTAHAQNTQPHSLNIGGSAPPLRLRVWLKGKPVQQFKKGKIYVVEFWATWCESCIAAMPHLSALAGQYRDRITILGIDVKEEKTTSVETIKAFVDSIGNQMDYSAAIEDGNFMVAGWLDASGEQGIPKSFVVNAEGKVAWIGHPSKLAEVLPQIVNNTWDIKKAVAERNLNKHLQDLDEDEGYNLYKYSGDPGKPDSALLAIKEIIRKEPRLEYAPYIASYTFSSLLKTNPHKAYEFGKMVLVTSTYDDPAYGVIFGTINSYSDKLNLPPEIYQLGAEAYQARINAYPETADYPKFYNKMAEWYWRANDKSKAIATEQKAIAAMKTEKDFSAADLAEFEFRLQQYKNR